MKVPVKVPVASGWDFLTEASDLALEIRIADFKGCVTVLLPLLLLLFEKPSTFCRRLEGPENHICHLLQRALKKVY